VAIADHHLPAWTCALVNDLVRRAPAQHGHRAGPRADSRRPVGWAELSHLSSVAYPADLEGLGAYTANVPSQLRLPGGDYATRRILRLKDKAVSCQD
jgi:hypothetical protein